MNCNKCNFQNDKDAKFCQGCGANLTIDSNKNIAQESNEKNVEKVVETKKTTSNNSSNENYISMIIGIITKPITTINTLGNKIDEINFSGIIAGIVILIGVISRLFKLIFTTVVYRNWSVWDGYSGYKVDFDRLEDFKFFSNFFDSLVAFSLIIGCIAGIYYIISLILKQDIKFPKLLAITSLALIPIFAFTYILSPILTLIYAQLGLVSSLIGFLFTGILLHEVINNLLTLDDDKKILINTICLTIVSIVSTIISVEFLLGISISDLSTLL